MPDFTYEQPMPFIARALGGRFMDARGACRMSWGDLNWGRRHLAPELSLGLFEEGFSFHVQGLGLGTWIKLPFLRWFAYHPTEIMDKWGWSFCDGTLHLCWAHRTKVLDLPFRRWRQVAHEVRRIDGTWAPYVGSWEERQPYRPGGKEPDGRHVETYPYRYLLRSGEVQDRTATIYVERRVRRLNWTPITRTSYAIEVEFSDEVGERKGSWKGGTIGCAYELKPEETPRQCLKRMEQERRF